MAERAGRLTVADLVVLALLHERPMHGYAASAELEYREARDWAGISRPQVYYSLKKLAEQGAEAYSEKPEAFADFIRAEAAKWGKVVKESGATAG